jgi:uncharacterized membrane protein YvbJ
MATCVGCGAQLAPEWKFCIHCGIAADAREITRDVPMAPTADPSTTSTRSRIFLIAGVSAFVVAAALLILAIAYLVGALN